MVYVTRRLINPFVLSIFTDGLCSWQVGTISLTDELWKIPLPLRYFSSGCFHWRTTICGKAATHFKVKKLLEVSYLTWKTMFDLFWNTKKTAENTMHSGIFLTNFEVFGKMVRHCLECLRNLPNLNWNFRENREIKGKIMNVW